MAKGKFASLVLRSGDAVLEGRGERIVKSARLAQKAIVDNLDQEIINLEDKREIMLDNSPDNRFSLKVGETFDAQKWAAEYQAISIQIINKKVELEIAQNNLKELFEEGGTE